MSNNKETVITLANGKACAISTHSIKKCSINGWTEGRYLNNTSFAILSCCQQFFEDAREQENGTDIQRRTS